MQPVLNVEDVRLVEQQLADAGVSLYELMDRAGAAASGEVMRVEDAHTVVVLAGYGNNGGDGWVAARALKNRGYEVTVVTPIAPEEIGSDLAHSAAEFAEHAFVNVVVTPSWEQLTDLLATADVALDAMLGTGFHGAPKEPFDMWIECLNASGAFVVSADVPSGLNAQTGRAPGAVVCADVTVTMICAKPGLLADDGRDVCGRIVVAPLDAQVGTLASDAEPLVWTCDVDDYADVLAVPPASSDKFSRGSVLVVGGSARFVGAPIMAARAAARAGAGYVTLAVPEPVVPAAQAHLLEVPVVGMPCDRLRGAFAAGARESVIDLARKADAVVAGPGMTVSDATKDVVWGLLQTDAPLVLDADALNCLARLANGQLDAFPELVRRRSALVLTPHRRELGRLVGLSDDPPATLRDAVEAARRIVWAVGGTEVCVVAKGSATACVGVNMAALPTPGPPALATAGSGDVLAGVMGAALARSARTIDYDNLPLLCALACETHGRAGTIAQERFGSFGVMAGDVADVVGLAADSFF